MSHSFLLYPARREPRPRLGDAVPATRSCHIIVRLRSSIVCVLGIAAVLPLTACGRKSITLVNEGQSEYTIVISPQSSPPQRYAAEELATFVEQISGARLSVADAPTDGPMVFVGPRDALQAIAPDIDYDSLGADGLVIRTVGDHLVLTDGWPNGAPKPSR